MTYTITKETTKSGRECVAVRFNEKPAEEIRERLKAARFWWFGKGGSWCGFCTEDEAREILEETGTGCAVADQARPVAKTGPIWDEFRAIIADTWKDEKMREFCIKRADDVVKVGGVLVEIERKSIETHFCYGVGYCGISTAEEWNEAGRMAEHARTSNEHFIRENMKEWIDAEALYTAALTPETADYMPGIVKDASGRRGFVRWCRIAEVCDAFGGSCRLSEVGGKGGTLAGQEIYFPTVSEVSALLAATSAASARHLKRVNTYLKRYGLRNVQSWTYLSD